MDQDSDEEEKNRNFGYDSGYKSANSGVDIPGSEPVNFTEISNQNELISEEKELD
jgi:hypothetical protein